MGDYRLYCLDANGKIRKAEWIQADGDEDALAQARALGRPTACELWQRNRLVGRVDPSIPQ